MMITASFLIALGAQGRDVAPIEVGIEVVETRVYSIKLTIGGKEGRFALDFSSGRSGLDETFLGKTEPGLVAVEANGRKIGEVRPLVVDFPMKALQGVVGRDILDRFVLGFDLERAKVVFWPKSPGLSSLADWVGPGAKEARLTNRAGVPCVEGASSTGRRFYFALTTASRYPTLTPAFAERFGFTVVSQSILRGPNGSEQKLDMGVSGPFGAANRTWPWKIFLRSPDGDDSDMAGTLHVGDFHGNRVVVDLPGNRIVHVPVVGREAILSALEGVLQLRLELREGKVFLKKREAPGYEVVADAELLEFSGKSTEEWLAKLENPGTRHYEFVSELHNNARTNPLKVRLVDGRIATVKTPGS